jgi:hypothetical protein
MSRFHTEKEAEYLRYSDECLTIADSTTNEPQRIMLRHIAETWLRLAESASDPSTPLDQPQ